MPALDLFYQSGHVPRRCCFKDAVPKIKYEWTLARCLKDAFGLGCQSLSPDHQHPGVKVPLDAAPQTPLDRSCGPAHRHGAIEPNTVRLGRLSVAVIEKACCTRECDHWNCRVLQTQGSDNFGDRLDAPSMEERFGQDASPTLKKLDRLGTGLDLPFQELNYGDRQEVDESLKSVWIAKRPVLDDGML